MIGEMLPMPGCRLCHAVLLTDHERDQIKRHWTDTSICRACGDYFSAQTKIERLREENEKMRAQNDKLRAENADLRAAIREVVDILWPRGHLEGEA